MQTALLLKEELPRCLKTIRRSPVQIFVTLRGSNGYYFNVDMTATRFNFEIAERSGKALFVSGQYKADKHGEVVITKLSTNLEKAHAEELLCCIERTVSLHRECNMLVKNNQHLLGPYARFY